MSDLATTRLQTAPTETAPDGTIVRKLLTLPRGSMAHFELAAGKISHAVTHRSVEEIWYVVSGRGEMWRRHGRREETVALEPGVCLTIPPGAHFQLRASASEPVAVIAVTMPPWPGEDEAVRVAGPWTPG